MRFSSTVICRNGLGIWCVRPMPMRARLNDGMCETSWPSNMTVPEVAWVAPLSMPTRVLLPAPLGPMTPSTSPLCTSRVISEAATTSPYRLVRPAQLRRTGPAASAGESPSASAIFAAAADEAAFCSDVSSILALSKRGRSSVG